jgi:hypothetical protein
MSKPDPTQHAKISNFDERVLVMSSLRKPKRIRIYGTDEKDYMFLVKVRFKTVRLFFDLSRCINRNLVGQSGRRGFETRSTYPAIVYSHEQRNIWKCFLLKARNIPYNLQGDITMLWLRLDQKQTSSYNFYRSFL